MLFRSKSKFVAEVTRYGGECKSSQQVDDNLQQLETEAERKKAVEIQLKYQKTVLETGKLLPPGKGKLLSISKLSLAEMVANLKEVITFVPHFEHLADLDSSTSESITITRNTLLTKRNENACWKSMLVFSGGDRRCSGKRIWQRTALVALKLRSPPQEKESRLKHLIRIHVKRPSEP